MGWYIGGCAMWRLLHFREVAGMVPRPVQPVRSSWQKPPRLRDPRSSPHDVVGMLR